MFSVVAALNGSTHVDLKAKPFRSQRCERGHQQPNSWHQLVVKCGSDLDTSFHRLALQMSCNAVGTKVIRICWNYTQCDECQTLSSLGGHLNDVHPGVLVMATDVHTLTHTKKACKCKPEKQQSYSWHQLMVKCGK